MSDRLQNAKSIFLKAVEQVPAGEWRAFVSESCAGNAALLARVEALLRAHARLGTYQVEARQMDVPAFPTKSHRAFDDTASFPGIPTQIGSYEVKRVLGQGAFGVVYLAHDRDLQRDVAIKRLMLERLSGFSGGLVTLTERFLQEGRLAALLKHPNIVTVHHVVRLENSDQPQLFIVQEFIEGIDLSEFLKQKGRDLKQVAHLMALIADAVGFAHQQGLVHRDLKPANILIDARGEPHVTDFGMAVDETLQRRLRGEISGTPLYMAPEQARGETHLLDGRADIWSLGVILYETLAGRRPFEGSTFSELSEQICHREPKPLRMIEPSLPEELERICLKCLRRKITDRYSTCADLVSDLRGWTEDVSQERAGVEFDGTDSIQLVLKIVGSPYIYVPEPGRDRVTIGRQRRKPGTANQGCDVAIRCVASDDDLLKISRKHLEVILVEGEHYVVDLSKWGTELNDQRLEKGKPTKIIAGDRLRIADVLELEMLHRARISAGPSLVEARIECRASSPDLVLNASIGDLTTFESCNE